MVSSDAAFAEFQDSNKPKVIELDPSIYDRPPVRIFNIYSDQHIITQSYGTFIIPACAEGEDVSEPCVIKGMVHDYSQVPGETLQLQAAPIPGTKVAEDMMNSYKLARQGCFISHGERPTAKELQAAKKELVPFLQARVAEADGLYNGNQDQRNSITASHRMAGTYLNLDKPWMNDSPSMARCEGCGSTYIPGAAFCPQGCVLDEARARKLRPWQFAGQKAS